MKFIVIDHNTYYGEGYTFSVNRQCNDIMPKRIRIALAKSQVLVVLLGCVCVGEVVIRSHICSSLQVKFAGHKSHMNLCNVDM